MSDERKQNAESRRPTVWDYVIAGGMAFASLTIGYLIFFGWPF